MPEFPLSRVASDAKIHPSIVNQRRTKGSMVELLVWAHGASHQSIPSRKVSDHSIWSKHMRQKAP
jgi:hypothetical protein